MQPNEPTRKDLLVSLIGQLQRDHDLAIKAENVGAAVTASKAIADLLSVKEETSRATNLDPFRGLSDADLENSIRHLTANLRASGGGHLIDGDPSVVSVSGALEQRNNEDTDLAIRVLALLEGRAEK